MDDRQPMEETEPKKKWKGRKLRNQRMGSEPVNGADRVEQGQDSWARNAQRNRRRYQHRHLALRQKPNSAPLACRRAVPNSRNRQGINQQSRRGQSECGWSNVRPLSTKLAISIVNRNINHFCYRFKSFIVHDALKRKARGRQ